jgi:hypothetical protein
MATMSPEELQERVNELELEAEMRERAVESLQREVEATEARLEVALRAELRANQDRELGHKIERQMQFRDTKAADDLETLAQALSEQEVSAVIGNPDAAKDVLVALFMVGQRLHEVAHLLRKPILTLSVGKPDGEGEDR